MAFFDKLSKSVTEVGQKTIAKTKELADTSKLNVMISEQERIITNQYLQIGRMYASIHKDDFEDEFKEMIAAIADADAKIKDYEKQIQEIKGVQCCEKCGAEVPDGAAFCSSCGAAMPDVQEPVSAGYIKCENCGAEIQEGMRFCTSCGKPVEAVSAALEENQPDVSPEGGCPDCSTNAGDGSDSCTE